MEGGRKGEIWRYGSDVDGKSESISVKKDERERYIQERPRVGKVDSESEDKEINGESKGNAEAP